MERSRRLVTGAISRAINSRRVAFGLTHEQVAERAQARGAGISESTVRHVCRVPEGSAIWINWRTALGLSLALGRPWADFTGGNGANPARGGVSQPGAGDRGPEARSGRGGAVAAFFTRLWRWLSGARRVRSADARRLQTGE